MKHNLSLYVPTMEDYWYEQKLLSDYETMYYNAGYVSDINEYDYNTGCINFDPSLWEERFEYRKDPKVFFSYIKDEDRFVGLASYQFDANKNIYVCGILIDSNERAKGYGKTGLKLLLDVAKYNGVTELYSCFEDGRGNINKIFLENGFEVVKTYDWVRFNEPNKGVLVKVTL